MSDGILPKYEVAEESWRIFRSSGKKLNSSTSFRLFSVSLISVRSDSFSFSRFATCSSTSILLEVCKSSSIESKRFLAITGILGRTVINAFTRNNSSDTCLVNSLSRSFFTIDETSFDNGSNCKISISCKTETAVCWFLRRPIIAIFAIATGLNILFYSF